MSPGLTVYTATRTTNGTSIIHTVPAGISYQVLHLVLVASISNSGIATLRINGVPVGRISGDANGNTRVCTRVLTVTVQPGTVFSVEASGIFAGTTVKGVAYISGYDVI